MSKSSAVIAAASIVVALSGVGYGVYVSQRTEARIAALEARMSEAEKITANDYFKTKAKNEEERKARRLEMIHRWFANNRKQQANTKPQEASN